LNSTPDIDVLDHVLDNLDRAIVIDAWIDLSVVGRQMNTVRHARNNRV
jgi:hypothetical protein